jgi:hypothetical protein
MRSEGATSKRREATMAYEKLVLHPQNPRAILHDPATLLDALRAKGLIRGSFGWNGENHYTPGPRYRELVLFRKFAEPAEGELHVSVSETAEEPAFLGASHAQPPHCPACRSPIRDWREQLLAWNRAGHPALWTCGRCRRRVAVRDLDWAHTGGIARYSLDLWGIGQGAAIPSAELLCLLEGLTIERWNYFYYRLGTELAVGLPSRVQPS